MSLTPVPAKFSRPLEGSVWTGTGAGDFPTTSEPAWRSNGGVGRLHPARACPFSLEVPLPEFSGHLRRVSIVGVLADHAAAVNEPAGSIGAVMQLVDSQGNQVAQLTLVQGRHYGDAQDGYEMDRPLGDGSSICTVGSVQDEGRSLRIDRLDWDVSCESAPDKLVFRDMGTPASFVVHDILFWFEEAKVCPFRGQGGKVSLGEVASIVRLRERVKFQAALDQTMEGILAVHDDLDEARGVALTFIAVVSAAMLETGSGKKLHRLQLDSARLMERAQTVEDVAELMRVTVTETVGGLLGEPKSDVERLVDHALTFLDRNFARDVSDEEVAKRLAVSTSHFRHVFRERTGCPFSKYLQRLRLERARELILHSDAPIADIAKQCGFVSPAHFSRAFQGRFNASPSRVRTAARQTG